MSITLREFVTKWGFEVDDGELKKLDKSFAETRKNMQKLADNMQAAGQKLTLFATLPIAAFSGFAVKAAAEASDFQARFETIFSSLGKDGVNAINKFGESLGLSSVETQKLVGGTGQLLKNLGFSEERSLDFAKSIATISADVAEFNNLEGGTAAANKIISDALAGRTQGLKQLGVVVDDDSIKAEMNAQKLAGMTFATEKQANAAAILALVQKQTVQATGAFTGATEDLDVSTAKLRARISNLTVSFGKILLPIAIKITNAISNIVDMFSGMSDTTKTVILVIAGLVAALGPLLILTGSLLNGIIAIRTAMVLFGNAAIVGWLKFFAGFLLVAAAAAAIFLIFDDIKGFFEGKDSVTGAIIRAVDEMVDAFQTKFPIIGTVVRGVIVGLLTPINLVINAVRTIAGIAGAIAGGGGISGVIDALKQGGTDFLSPFKSLREGTGFSLGEAVGFGERSTLPTTSAVAAGSNSNVSQSVNAPITVNVPQGTPPEQVGPAVQRGVSEGLGSLLRETQRQTKTAVVN